MNYAQVLAGELRGAFERQDHPAFTRLLARMVAAISYAGPGSIAPHNDERVHDEPVWVGVDPGAGDDLTVVQPATTDARKAAPLHFDAQATERALRNLREGCTRRAFPCECQGPARMTCMYRCTAPR